MILEYFLRKQHVHGDVMIENTSKQLHVFVHNSPKEEVGLTKIFQSELFGLAIKQVSPIKLTFLEQHVWCRYYITSELKKLNFFCYFSGSGNGCGKLKCG